MCVQGVWCPRSHNRTNYCAVIWGCSCATSYGKQEWGPKCVRLDFLRGAGALWVGSNATLILKLNSFLPVNFSKRKQVKTCLNAGNFFRSKLLFWVLALNCQECQCQLSFQTVAFFCCPLLKWLNRQRHKMFMTLRLQFQTVFLFFF